MAQKLLDHWEPIRGPFMRRLFTFAFLIWVTPTLFADPYLGSKDYYVNGADTITAPLFLTNFTNVSITQLKFVVEFPQNKIAFDHGALNSELQPNWSLSETPSGSNRVSMELNTGQAGLNQDWKQIISLIFIRTGLSANESISIKLFDLEVNNSGIGTDTSFFFIHDKALPSKGDINVDSKVNFDDAQVAFNRLTSLQVVPDTLLEISNVRGVGMHDVALLFQHAIGLLPTLPNPSLPAPISPDTIITMFARIEIKTPTLLGGDLYQYNISGTNLQELISASMTIEVDTSIVASIQGVSAWSSSALLYTALNGPQLSIDIASPEAIAVDSLDWITLIVQHKPGQTSKGLTNILSENLNDTRIQRDISTTKRSTNSAPLHAFLKIKNGKLYYRSARKEPGNISLYNLQGQAIYSIHFEGEKFHFTLPTLDRQTYLIVVQQGRHQHLQKIILD